MSDKYYRRKNNELKTDNPIDELTNIILDIQQKIKYLENTISLKNIFRYKLKNNIYIHFDKDFRNIFNNIINNSLN